MNRLERTYEATPEEIWELWTTPVGIESWWAPDGFAVEVEKLELRPGGELVYAMTATGPEQIEFMQNAGMPLTTRSRKAFIEIDEPKRLAYNSTVDFVPGVEPYEFLTVVDLQPSAAGVSVVMTVEAMHDEEWTQRLLRGVRMSWTTSPPPSRNGERRDRAGSVAPSRALRWSSSTSRRRANRLGRLLRCVVNRRMGGGAMGDRAQRLKGKANEAAGKAKAAAGYQTYSGKTEAKGEGKALKGKAQQAVGKARSTAKKKTR